MIVVKIRSLVLSKLLLLVTEIYLYPFYYLFYCVQDHWKCGSLSQLSSGRRWGYTLNESLVYHSTTLDTLDNLKIHLALMHVLDTSIDLELPEGLRQLDMTSTDKTKVSWI